MIATYPELIGYVDITRTPVEEDTQEMAFPPTADMTNAFPGREYQTREWWPGMSIRDVYAGQAMAAIITAMQITNAKKGIQEWLTDDISNTAFQFADSMMKARQRVE